MQAPPPPPPAVAFRFALTPVRADDARMTAHRTHVGMWRCPTTMTAPDAAVAVRAQLATAFNDERAARGALPGMIAMCGAPCDAWRGVAARFGVQLHVVSPPSSSLWSRLMAVFWRQPTDDVVVVHLARHPLAFVVCCEACDDEPMASTRTVTSVEELVHRLAVCMHDRLVASSRPESADDAHREPMFARAARRMVAMTSSDSESSHSSDADDSDDSSNGAAADDDDVPADDATHSNIPAAASATDDYPEAAAAAPAACAAPIHTVA